MERRMVLGWMAGAPALALAQAKKTAEEDVSPAEDLMREHGVLKRVLLVYREIMRRRDANQDTPPEALTRSARLIRTFVEDYHEKLEEDCLFPRFRKANQQVELVDTLKRQHDAGRALTDRLLGAVKGRTQKAEVRGWLAAFVRMYEPHEAREDTVLFPAFHKLVSQHEWDALGEDFEKKENQIFHGDGFEKNVAEVAAIEKMVGIYDLAQFTPPV